MDTTAFRTDLLAWYEAHARDLPWRRDATPYATLVSEVMLQQTRVETVIPYYHRWLERFPDIDALAMAAEDDVLHAWEGLGYYSRARNLHGAARVVRERYNGAMPTDAETLRELPGVGDYTAGAVASIAFGRVEPAVDGNVRRVLARLFDLEAPTPREAREHAATLVDPERPGDFNQAMMELGATVCTPRSPACLDCPVRAHCLAFARGTVEQRPATKKRNPVPAFDLVTLVAFDRAGRVLLRQRPPSGLLANLWEFPSTQLQPGSDPEDQAHVLLATLTGGRDGAVRGALDAIEHVFTHRRERYHPIVMDVGADRPLAAERCAWRSTAELREIAMPRAQRRIQKAMLEAGTRGR